jgi:hypothetical protein
MGYGVVVDDIDDDGNLACGWAEVDEYNSSDLNVVVFDLLSLIRFCLPLYLFMPL